ncbi:MAG TPA: substrate-binding domain-containing protein [Terriglobia bacterium]|nr:substrate-binding domain-containing protein [Terriglobia bacterium]
MGRVQNNLAIIRKRRGIGASELARKVGVTRQTIYAIEAGTYVPNTEVTLQLARHLEVNVEELFSLQKDQQEETAPTVSADYLGQTAPGSGQAVRVCKVGTKWVSVPVDARPYHLPEADAVVTGSPARLHKAKLWLFSEEEMVRNKIVLAGCDPATSLLARMVERLSGVEIVHAPASSQLALDWLKDGKVHIAGSHLQDPDSTEFNLPHIRRQFPNRDMAVVTFARWEEGFVVAPGNPKNIRKVSDLQRKNVIVMNREAGSGSRALLDTLLHGVGLQGKVVRGYDRVAFGHLSAAHAVLAGDADCCIATRSAAQTFGLDFVPLRSEQYDFVLHRETLRMAAVESLFDALQRATLRRKLETLAGYDTSQTGVIRA